MKQQFAGKWLTKIVACTTLLLGLFAMKAHAGVDIFEVYLNNKLILRQTMDKPLDLKTLPITAANINDKLVVKYLQCREPDGIAKKRSISLRDADGKVVKEWTFHHPGVKSASMQIPVKELLAVQKNADGQLYLFYAAEGRPNGQKLAALPEWKLGNT